MEKCYLSILAFLVFGLVGALSAQPTCDNPEIIVQDNFDSYTTGALGPQANHWTTWSGNEGGAEDGIVTNDLALSQSNSLLIEGTMPTGGPQDVLLLLGNKSAGMYILKWQMFVPAGSGAYYNIQHFETPGTEWALETSFGTAGTGTVSAGQTDARSFSYPQDDFFEVRHIIDVDNNRIYLFIAGDFVYSWPFNWQATTNTGTKQLGAVDFFAEDDSNYFYVDDVYYAGLPAAGTGQYCHMAIPVDVGTYTAGELDCFGAGFTVRSAGQGNAGAWYAYTAPGDGILTVSSCGGGSDTRVWIFSGGCENLNVEGINDDRCEISPGGDAYASSAQALVTGGQTYLIVWDDIWEVGGFDFTIDFSTDAPAAGDFCETAIAVTPGIHTIDSINGNGAVAGPKIGHLTSSTTPYSQSEWYSFTPAQDGKMTVSTCGMTSEDTRLWIYTGECGIETLQLLASSDDSCDVQSLVLERPVTAGTNYYIEWDSEDTNSPGFEWDLTFDPETGTEESAVGSSFRISPNPASGTTFLTYDFSEATDLTFRLVDNFGRLMSSYSLPKVVEGSEKLDLSCLPSGIYFVVVTNGKSVATERLVVK